MVKVYIQDNIIKERNQIYYDRASDKPYKYIGTSGISFTLNSTDWLPSFEVEPEKEEEIVFIDINAEPHEIIMDRCSDNIDIYIKYLKKYVETVEDKIAERVRYNYSLLVVGENVYKLNENVDILNSNGVTFIHATASSGAWVVEDEMDLYIRQLDGAKYPYHKNAITDNIEGVSYSVASNLSFTFITNEEKRTFPSLLDKGNEITSIDILGKEIKNIPVEVSGDINNTYNITANITKEELATMVGENNLLPVAVSFNSTKVGIPFKQVVYIKKVDIPLTPAV